MVDYKKYISIDPEVRFGKPVVTGSRISVYDVLGWLASGMSAKGIMDDYPEISEVQIQACLAYAADKEHKIRVAS